MRAALLAPELTPSYGWARYAYELVDALSAQGVQLVALTQAGSAPPADLPPEVELRPVLPVLVPPVRGFLLRSLLALPRVRRAAQGCDLLHAAAEPYSLLAAWSAGRRPLIVTAHGTYVPLTARRPLIGWLYRRAYRRAQIIAVSSYTAAQVQAVLPVGGLHVIRNGVHAARFQEPAPAPTKHGPTILATGGVKRRKGTHLLIDALAQVRQRLPDAQLVVTGQGDPDYLAEVQRQIAARDLQECVHLVGMIQEAALRGWYQGADVFALPSLNVGAQFEGFGLVFLEASAAGLPVIGTRGSGVEEAVVEGQTGLLVPQDDAGALGAAILRVLTDDALGTRLGAAGRAYARTQDWSQVAAQVRALYAACLGDFEIRQSP